MRLTKAYLGLDPPVLQQCERGRPDAYNLLVDLAEDSDVDHEEEEHEEENAEGSGLGENQQGSDVVPMTYRLIMTALLALVTMGLLLHQVLTRRVMTITLPKSRMG